MTETLAPLPISPKSLLRKLETAGIPYQLHHHAPVFTVAESEKLKTTIEGLECRNLFLRDKKGSMFLITAGNDTKIDLKELPALLGCGRLSFGSAERLWENLGIRPGSVNPFCIMNAQPGQVQLILDAAIMSAHVMNVHPMDNAMTIGLSPADLLRFVGEYGHTPKILDFSLMAAA